jgi:hypothetical protein
MQVIIGAGSSKNTNPCRTMILGVLSIICYAIHPMLQTQVIYASIQNPTEAHKNVTGRAAVIPRLWCAGEAIPLAAEFVDDAVVTLLLLILVLVLPPPPLSCAASAVAFVTMQSDKGSTPARHLSTHADMAL